jgi:hypothetical protein
MEPPSSRPIRGSGRRASKSIAIAILLELAVGDDYWVELRFYVILAWLAIAAHCLGIR